MSLVALASALHKRNPIPCTLNVVALDYEWPSVVKRNSTIVGATLLLTRCLSHYDTKSTGVI